MMRLRADVFHGNDFSTPYVPLRPSVMTVHDLAMAERDTRDTEPQVPHELNGPDAKSRNHLDRPWQPHSARVRRRTAMLLACASPPW